MTLRNISAGIELISDAHGNAADTIKGESTNDLGWIELACDGCGEAANMIAGGGPECLRLRAAEAGWTKFPHPEIELDYCPRCA